MEISLLYSGSGATCRAQNSHMSAKLCSIRSGSTARRVRVLLVRAACSSVAQRNKLQSIPLCSRERASIKHGQHARAHRSIRCAQPHFQLHFPNTTTRKNANSGVWIIFKSFTHPIEPLSVPLPGRDVPFGCASLLCLPPLQRAVQPYSPGGSCLFRCEGGSAADPRHVPCFTPSLPETADRVHTPPPARERSPAAQLAAAAVCSQPRRRNRLHTHFDTDCFVDSSHIPTFIILPRMHPRVLRSARFTQWNLWGLVRQSAPRISSGKVL